jgi:hypothetical protein
MCEYASKVKYYSSFSLTNTSLSLPLSFTVSAPGDVVGIITARYSELHFSTTITFFHSQQFSGAH